MLSLRLYNDDFPCFGLSENMMKNNFYSFYLSHKMFTLFNLTRRKKNVLLINPCFCKKKKKNLYHRYNSKLSITFTTRIINNKNSLYYYYVYYIYIIIGCIKHKPWYSVTNKILRLQRWKMIRCTLLRYCNILCVWPMITITS